jgi:cytochrome c oxidase subunit 2
LADEAAIKNVVAYIKSLPEVRPTASVVGDPTRGQEHYETCAACHGEKAQGIWATNAPRLSNMSDWYMARQLRNFREGIRGGHPQDFYGEQMRSMAKVLSDDDAVADVLDYVRTL